MQNLDLLSPWLTFAVILIPLVYLERWIHQHLYGVGWLLTEEKERATLLYYVILLPGVFLHEATQWLVAGALKQKTSKVKVWPKPQANGSIRYDFVKLSRQTGRPAALVVGFTPLLVGVFLILFISRNIFAAPGLGLALNSRNLEVVLIAFRNLFGTPDFWLWLYLLFAIGNAMLPTPSEVQGWQYIVLIFAIITGALFVIGLGEAFLITTMSGPITQALNTLAAAFAVVLIVDVFAVIILGSTEQVLEKVTGRKARYPKPKITRTPKPEPGSEAPLPRGDIPLRIAERQLPIPPPPKRQKKPKTPLPAATQAPLPGSPDRTANNTLPGTAPTQALGASSRPLFGERESTQPAKPAFNQDRNRLAYPAPDSGEDTAQVTAANDRSDDTAISASSRPLFGESGIAQPAKPTFNKASNRPLFSAVAPEEDTTQQSAAEDMPPDDDDELTYEDLENMP